jgi:hypothetical protein
MIFIELYAVFPLAGNDFNGIGPKALGHVPCFNYPMGSSACIESKMKILWEVFCEKNSFAIRDIMGCGGDGARGCPRTIGNLDGRESSNDFRTGESHPKSTDSDSPGPG